MTNGEESEQKTNEMMEELRRELYSTVDKVVNQFRRDIMRDIVSRKSSDSRADTSTPYSDGEREYKNVGQFLRYKRNKLRLSLRRLGDLAGLDFTLIYQVETDMIRPSRATLDALAPHLDVSPGELYVAAGLWPKGVPRSKEALETLRQRYTPS